MAGKDKNLIWKALIFLIVFIAVIFISLLFIKIINMEKIVRYPAYAGKFYPKQPKELESMIRGLLKGRNNSPDSAKGIMVPHAGYPFSGSVAAEAFSRVVGKKVGTVFILGDSHTSVFSGLAIDDSDIWLTPLGEVEVDKKKASKLAKGSKNIFFNSDIHKNDHILEVELPFLQIALEPGFKIVPIVFGGQDKDWKELASLLDEHMEEDDLIVASSDMSHYPPYEEAVEVDKKTLGLIKSFDIDELERHISDTIKKGVPGEETLLCGRGAVKTLMELAFARSWKCGFTYYSNSGEAEMGDKEAVVGYGAAVFHSDDLLTREQKKELLEIAKRSVEHSVRTGYGLKEVKIQDKRLERKEGVFVTLRKKGELRGCIGNIGPSRSPLWENVREMAAAAALKDTRFLPVSTQELDELKYEISVLSKPRPINDWREVKPGRDGVILEKGLRKGVFLPQVAEENSWDKEQLLSNLCSHKAGLPLDCYKNDPDVKIKTFTAQVFSEDDI